MGRLLALLPILAVPAFLACGPPPVRSDHPARQGRRAAALEGNPAALRCTDAHIKELIRDEVERLVDQVRRSTRPGNKSVVYIFPLPGPTSPDANRHYMGKQVTAAINEAFLSSDPPLFRVAQPIEETIDSEERDRSAGRNAGASHTTRGDVPLVRTVATHDLKLEFESSDRNVLLLRLGHRASRTKVHEGRVCLCRSKEDIEPVLQLLRQLIVGCAPNGGYDRTTACQKLREHLQDYPRLLTVAELELLLAQGQLDQQCTDQLRRVHVPRGTSGCPEDDVGSGDDGLVKLINQFKCFP